MALGVVGYSIPRANRRCKCGFILTVNISLTQTVKKKEVSRLDLEVAGHKDAVNMVEAGASEITEQEMLEAIFFGHEEIQRLVDFQQQIVDHIGLS